MATPNGGTGQAGAGTERSGRQTTASGTILVGTLSMT
jgi:hypothetical protein